MANSRRTFSRQQRAVETQEALLVGAARVFSRLPYAEARLKDIAQASGVSEGSLHFHYGTKSDVAKAVLEAEQERMTVVLSRALGAEQSGLRKLIELVNELAQLIASDVVVQAGIRLSGQPIVGLEDSARGPYFEWIEIARTLIQQGVDDGSIHPNVEASTAAEYVNSLFVGAQVLAGLADSWASMPERIAALEPFLSGSLSTVGRGF